MRAEDFAELKRQQDGVQSRTSKLLEVLVPLRQSFIEAMRGYVKQALDAGLDGYEPVLVKEQTPEYLEATFRLNGFPFIAVSTNEVYEMCDDPVVDCPFTGRLLFYFAGDDHNKPMVEVRVQEVAGGGYACTLGHYRIRTEGGEEMDRLIFIPKMTGDSGRILAVRMFEHFTTFRSCWDERPLLAHMRIRNGGNRRSLGFVRREGP